MSKSEVSVFSELKNPVFYRRAVRIMLPVLMQQLITVGINFADNIMVGRFAEAQISGVSLSNQFYNIFQFVFVGVGAGAVVMTSQFWGRRDTDGLKLVSSMALKVSLVIGLIFFIFGFFTPGFVLRIFTNDETIVAAGTGYMRLLGSTFLITGLSTTATFLLRSVGQIRIPLIGSFVAFVLNLFFNWVFIFGKFGMPRMESVGAAVGTVIARVFEFLFVFGYFIFREQDIGFRLKHFLLKGGGLRRTYIKYSVPTLVSDALLGIGIALSSVIMGHISATLVTATAIVRNATQLLTVANVGWAQSSAVIIGNTIGEGKPDRAYREGMAYIIMSVLLGLVCAGIYFAFADPYISFFTITDETRIATREIFVCSAIMSPFETLAHLTSKGIMRGGGDTRFVLFGDIILLWGVSIPLGALAGFAWHMAPVWIYFFLKLEYGLKSLIFLGRFFTKRWIHEIKRPETITES